MSLLNKDLSETETPTKDATPQPTPEQAAVISAETSPGEVVKVMAYAGTGKTSTFIGLAESRPANRLLYLAFNKSVETDARGKFPGNVTCKTVHALAYGAVGRKFRDIKGDTPVWEIAKRLRVPLYHATLINRTLTSWFNSADNKLSEAHVEPDVLGMCRPGYEAGIIEHCETLWSDMQRETGGLYMTHGGYLKLYQLTTPDLSQYDYILLDEAQDTNPVTQDIVLSQTARGARVYLAGDPYQQIYAWRGAVDVMQNIPCREFRITQSFRFGPRIAGFANTILQKLLGEQVPVLGLDAIPDSTTSKQKTIIARTNSSLFHYAANLHGQIHVVGTSQFIFFMKDLMDLYHLWERRKDLIESTRFKAGTFEDLKYRAEETLDVELLGKLRLVEEFRSEIPRVCDSVRRRLSAVAEGADIILTTCHKAKGLEWPHVLLSDDFEDFFSSGGLLKRIVKKLVKPGDDVATQEEANLLYVAATRAKNVLTPNNTLTRLEKYENPSRV